MPTRTIVPVRNPLALIHLLSLDAPAVAALWTWFLARATHVPLSPLVPIAMFLAVWILYAADRLLDSLHTRPTLLEARHHFHARHRRTFTTTAFLAATALAALLPHVPAARATIVSVLALAVALGIWLTFVHTRTTPLPKELALGFFFAAAVALPSLTRHSLIPAAALALLCALNCVYIHTWEHPSAASSDTHPWTLVARHNLPALGVATVIVACVSKNLPIAASILLAVLLLATLHHLRRRIDPITLRAAADLVLLTPLLTLPFLR